MENDNILDSRGGSTLAWLRFAAVGVLGAGLLYPALATLAGQALFPEQARGSLIERDGVVVGSRLVAQPFVGDGYFQPRPSAVGYKPIAAGGSNLAPGNPALRERMVATSAEIAAREGVPARDIPADLVTASGSGLDPHLSPAATQLQVARVARARGLPVEVVQATVQAHTLAPTFGVFGQSRVNVLELNLALDAMAP
ncbi:potassium-transporting ATPase subunit KdpC [Arenimonas sp. MALMAid1274]|uniref:potassium-transporting ATPase subunit KdpC n=1 Tax=Arenimonas sp. MALMAid1274 TaxID=3411630 RepID=UPI003BA07C14